MQDIPENYASYDALLAGFAEFYLREKANATIIGHMVVPVESNLIRALHALGLIGDWDGPYPLIDVAGCLDQAGEDPTSVDKYAAKVGVAVDPADFGGAHNPLYDAAQAAAVYRHLRDRRTRRPPGV